MGVLYLENCGCFKLDTARSSYIMAVCPVKKSLLHIYYGPRVSDDDFSYALSPYKDYFTETHRDDASFFDSAPFEYPAGGAGDFREAALSVKAGGQFAAARLEFCGYKIYGGASAAGRPPELTGGANACETLEISLTDSRLSLGVTLEYTVYEACDCLTRRAVIKNLSAREIVLTRALSACVSLSAGDYNVLKLTGSWAREFAVSSEPLTQGKTVAESSRGQTSHQAQPFFAVTQKNADYETGAVYAVKLIYSGSFYAVCERDQFDRVRVCLGINPHDFLWPLASGGVFVTPQAALNFSDTGYGQMSRNFHDLYRNHLPSFKDITRPVLINSWEACYFDFDRARLLDLAKNAASCGIELFVLDDGWFGRRDSDNSSLGDWVENEKKLGGSLCDLAREINALGLKFGLWIEPEMVSPDSDLCRARPDWVIKTNFGEPTLCREQWVLDITKKEVFDYVLAAVSALIEKAPVEYIKWDMNRPLTDVAGGGAFTHKYVLALYALQGAILERFTHLFLENCAGGGGRFDPAMLYFSPQIWASDDTDAFERLKIQEGAFLLYPISAVGSHVSVCPNHITGRSVPFQTRANVALFGSFGYELDVTKLNESEKAAVREQIKLYKRHNPLIRRGDYFRIASVAQNGRFDCLAVTAKDKSAALALYVNGLIKPNAAPTFIKLKGLDPNAAYVCEQDGKRYMGSSLMQIGFYIGKQTEDFSSQLLYFERQNGAGV